MPEGTPRRPTLEFAEKLPVQEPGAVYLARQTSEKSAVSAISDEYVKRCIIATNHIVANPGGMIVPYEGGYGLLALMEKNWTGNKALVKTALDAMMDLQNSGNFPYNGSWDQMYYPSKSNAPYEDAAGHRRQVDSGAAMMMFAMADYDKRNSSTTYKSNFRKAADFLYDLRWEISSYYEGATLKYRCLLKNQVINGVKEDLAFAADVAEAIMALVRGLEAYGTPLTTDPGGNDIETFLRELAEGIDFHMWSESNYWYQTEYPLNGESECRKDPDGNPIKLKFKQCVTFVQALAAWAFKRWDDTYNPNTSLAQDAASGQKNVVVTSGHGTRFAIGDQVLIKDDLAEEKNKVQGITADTLTMENNLSNTYTVANNAYIKVIHNLRNQKALNQVIANNPGRWGGFIEHMEYTAYDPPQEYTHYAALMRIAMNQVDSTRYSRWISKTQSFLRKCALADGQVMDQVFPDGRAIPSPWSRGPTMVAAATAILAGA